MGFGKTRRDVKCVVQEHLQRKGTLKGTSVSNGWWEKFLRRNPNLSLRSGDSTAHVRMDAVNAENLHSYYHLLKEVYDENGFADHPEAIYNMDETGVPLEPRPPKVVAAKGKKKIRYRTSGQKSQITVIGCASASGQILPPFIIFAAKQLNELWTRNEVTGSRYAVSDKGWVDQELFYFWLKVHFIPNAISQRPLLLLLDGHSSHFEPGTIQHARDNNIIIFCLPPHTTHECQPLDCSLFGPLKKHWQESCHNFYQTNPGKVISKLNFNSVFRSAWLNAVTPANICGGFRKAGVYPYNPDAVEIPDSSLSSGHESGDTSGGSEGISTVNGSGDSAGSGGVSGDSSGASGGGGDGTEIQTRSPDDSSGHSGTMNDGGTDLLDGSSAVNDPFCDLDGGDPSGSISTDGDPSPKEISFTLEEEVRFAIRFEEGYDLFDPKYTAWLRIHHPGSCATEKASESPLSRTPSTAADSTVTGSGQSKGSSTTESGLCTGGSPSIAQRSTNSTPVRSGVATPVSNSSSAKSGKHSPLSDLLNLPKVTTPVTTKTGRARVLTSSECLHLLKEKEDKKRQIAEEKERRKQERELKKQQKEEEKKRKAEEKARKLAEREAEKARKLAEKEEKAKEKAEKAKEKSNRSLESAGAKRKADEGSTSERAYQRTKRRRILGDMDENINTEVCCVCYGTYLEDVDTGRQWLECSCTRWIHEDCIDDDDVDSSGKLCPLC